MFRRRFLALCRSQSGVGRIFVDFARALRVSLTSSNKQISIEMKKSILFLAAAAMLASCSQSEINLRDVSNGELFTVKMSDNAKSVQLGDTVVVRHIIGSAYSERTIYGVFMGTEALPESSHFEYISSIDSLPCSVSTVYYSAVVTSIQE